MKATIVLLADNKLSNIGNSLLYEANCISEVGYEMTRMPFHVSLKQPFVVEDLATIEKLFDEFDFKPVKIKFEKLSCFPHWLGSSDTGGMFLKTESKELRDLQKKLFGELKEKIGDCPAEHDNDYIFHMTIAIGDAKYSNYVKAYEVLKDKIPKDIFTLDKLALFIYTDDTIKPGTYFCYKIKQ